ncbi:putative UDP-kanosamine synthase oxidoreductase subunit [compost metagenome]
MDPNPGSWFSQKDKLGGGVLFSHGCHYIDLLIWLLGNPVSVAGIGTRLGTEWMEGEGTHHSILQFESGALAQLFTSWGTKYRSRPALLHVHTTGGCFILGSDMLEVITEEGRKTLYEAPQSKVANSSALGEVEHFLDSIQTGTRPMTDGFEGMKSHRVIWALYSHQATPISLDGGRG